MENELRNYWVVFENIKEGTHKGVRTRTIFKDEAELIEHCKHPNVQAWYKVVAKGVTEEESIRVMDEHKAINVATYIKSHSKLLGELLNIGLAKGSIR